MYLLLIGIFALIFGCLAGFLFAKRKLKKITGTKNKDIQILEEEVNGLKEKNISLEASNQYLTQSKNEFIEENGKKVQIIESKDMEITQLKVSEAALGATNTSLINENKSLEEASSKKIKDQDDKFGELRQEKEAIGNELAALKEQEPIRTGEHTKIVEQLNIALKNVEKDKEKEQRKKEEKESKRLQLERETWSRHEGNVEKDMRLVCHELQIEYIDKFPLHGTPDNVVKIGDEFVVFDSKSPQGEDLSNFSTYIKSQAESLKKYVKHDEVKKDIYMVVPRNGIEKIKETYIQMGGYRVHIITPEALRPCLIHLKKIEDYEFAEQLSPENRDQLMTVIGRMSHGIKRSVQINQYMATEFFSILNEVDKIPTEILDGAIKVENSSKLNPPMEKRAKRIKTSDLLKVSQKIAGKAAGQEINLDPVGNSLEMIPLHKNTQNSEECTL